MAIELATAYVSIVPSASGIRANMLREFGPDIDRAATDSGDRAGKGFGSAFGAHIVALGGLAAAAFAGAKVVTFLKDSVGAASDLSEVMSKASQIFGDEAIPALEDYAKTSAKTMGQSKKQALDAAATFGVFGKSAGLAGGELVDFSTEMVGLSSDLASFGNTTVDDAIQSIGAALRGESEPIRKYGVLLDDATLRQRALSLGIISTTKDALTPAQKVLAAQAEILAQTGDAQGDFARTSEGLANQQRILAAQVENAKAKMGEALLPMMVALAGFANRTLIPAFESFIDLAGVGIARAIEIGRAAIDGVRGVLDGFQSGGGGKFLDFMKQNEEVFKTAAIAAGTFAVSLVAINKAMAGIAAVKTAFSTMGTAITSLGPLIAAHPILILAAVIIAIAAAAIYAYKHFEPFRNVVDAIARTMRDFVVGAFERVSALLRGFGAAASAGVADIRTALTPLVGWVKENLIPVFRAAGEFFAALFGRISELVNAWWSLMQAVWGVVGPVVAAALEVMRTAIDAFVKVAKPLLEGWLTALGQYFAFVWDVIKNVVEAALGVIRGIIMVATGLLTGDWSKAWEGLKTIVTSVLGNIYDIVRGIPGRVQSALGNIGSTLWESGRALIQGLINGIHSMWDFVRTAATAVPGWALAGIGHLGSILWDAGRDMMRGFINGIKSMAGDIRDAALSPVKGAVGAVTGFLHIGSPSKLMFDIGVDTMMGMELGMASRQGNLEAAGEGAASAITGPITAVKPTRAAVGTLGAGGAGRGGNINNVTINTPNRVDPRGVVREWEWYSRTAGV